ncbi:putative 39S ribosomal protein L24, mitochondrial [Armadillidium vulgare]|nr:putative 39S ribosomal protein L24, mitochondrial [Armadillidium vulgare]
MQIREMCFIVKITPWVNLIKVQKFGEGRNQLRVCQLHNFWHMTQSDLTCALVAIQFLTRADTKFDMKVADTAVVAGISAVLIVLKYISSSWKQSLSVILLHVEWKTPKGIQYQRAVIKRKRYLFTLNRPWTREFFYDNEPGTKSPTIVLEPIVDYFPFYSYLSFYFSAKTILERFMNQKAQTFIDINANYQVKMLFMDGLNEMLNLPKNND